MAATIQIAPPIRATSPLAIWHLCSLDAPTVAALWTWLIARTSHVRLPLATPVAMALAVWILYVADRILDARRIGHARAELEARHLFHHRHRRAFLAGIGVAAAALAALVPSLAAAALRLDLVETAVLLAWFLTLHATSTPHHLPKELAVGLFFSAAVFIPTVARDPALRAPLLPAAILFAALCSLNCLFIYAWEHEGACTRRAHPTTRFALPRLQTLATALACIGILVSQLPLAARPVTSACALAALALLALDHYRHRLSRIHVRAAADLALLTPLLLLPRLRG